MSRPENTKYGRCQATARSTDEQCGRAAVGEHGKCGYHGGKAGAPEGNQNAVGNGGGSAPEGNQNAKKHGLHSTPEYLLEDLSEKHLDTYHATFEALCTRYERIHSYEPDYAAKKRLSRVAVEIVKEDLADEYLKEHHSSHILVEDEVIGYDPESGPVEVSQTNKILPELTQLKRETRLTLKDMGLLEDPESQKADAMGGLLDEWKASASTDS